MLSRYIRGRRSSKAVWISGLAALIVLSVGVVSAQASGLTVEGKVLGSTTKIECSSASIAGTQEGMTGQASMSLSGCVAQQPAGCLVTVLPSPPTFATHLKEVAAGKQLEILTPGSGPSTFKFKLTNCAAEGTYSVGGSIASPGHLYGGYQTINDSLTFSAANNAEAGVSVTLAGNPATISGTVARTLNVKTGGPGGPPVALKWRNFGGTPFPETGRTVKSAGVVAFRWNLLAGLGTLFTCNVETPETTFYGSGAGAGVFRFTHCVAPESRATCVPEETLMSSHVTSTVQGINGNIYQVIKPTETYFLNVRLKNCGGVEWMRVAGASFAAKEGEIGVYNAGKPFTFSLAAEEEADASGLSASGYYVGMTGSGTLELTTGEAFTAS